MKSKSRMCAKRATWLAFSLVALATASHAISEDSTDTPSNVAEAPISATTESGGSTQVVQAEAINGGVLDRNTEAVRAYQKAMATLAALTAPPPAYTFDPSLANAGSTSSLLSAIIPSIHGQGPIGSAFRIAAKIHYFATKKLGGSISKDTSGSGGRRKDEELRGKAIKVVDLLEHSADLGNQDALYSLAHLSLFPPNRYFRSDPKAAFDRFLTHSQATGNATSQAYVAFFYGTGYHSVVPVDQAKAQLYYTFAANGGDKNAQTALGYRYWSGIATSDSCEHASIWYEAAAEQSISKFTAGPPGGRTLPQTPTKLSDLVGGIYGPGASVASTGLNAQRPAIKAGMARDAGETWEDVLEYYLFNADRGETDFAYRLGKIFYQGSIYSCHGGIASGSEGVGAIPRNFAYARHYFLQIARPIWPRDPPNPLSYQPKSTKEENLQPGYAPHAAGYLGRIYLRGEGVKADPAMAKMWFERGAEYGDRECYNGLGLIYRDGLVPSIKPDVEKAMRYFRAAVQQDLVEAQVNVGKYHYERGEFTVATPHFEAAVRLGSPFEAYHYLGQLALAQANTPGLSNHLVSSSCAMAVSFNKLVAERGSWDNDLLREAEIAWMSNSEHGKEIAMLKWWIAAEMGIEVAQSNLAYVLDQDKSILRLTRFSPMTPSNDTASLALTQWTRAAAQRNIDALVKVGDYYYHGLGVPENDQATRFEKAARYYQSAADTHMSALAMWNLGWMYENGVGVPQDFHLAKRHYDLAYDTNAEAYLPVVLSLVKLYVKSIWHTMMGGKGGLNIWDFEAVDMRIDSGSREGKEIDGRTEQPSDARESEGKEYIEEEDGPWYLGKAKEDFHKRRQSSQQQTEEDDPIQWARDRRNADLERDSDFGPEDYFDGALRGGNREDIESDDATETLLLILLCLAIAVLLYIRTRIVERMRRDQGEQRPQGQDAQNHGVFPPPGDPVRNEWAVQR